MSIVKPHGDLVSATVIDPDVLNDQFDTLYSAVNGGVGGTSTTYTYIYAPVFMDILTFTNVPVPFGVAAATLESAKLVYSNSSPQSAAIGISLTQNFPSAGYFEYYNSSVPNGTIVNSFGFVELTLAGSRPTVSDADYFNIVFSRNGATSVKFLGLMLALQVTETS